jgi:hypothetical protein
LAVEIGGYFKCGADEPVVWVCCGGEIVTFGEAADATRVDAVTTNAAQPNTEKRRAITAENRTLAIRGQILEVALRDTELTDAG